MSFNLYGAMMAIMSVGAIYATQSKLLQRVYVPSVDDSEIANQHVGVGESIVLIPMSTYVQGGGPAVQAVIGTPTITGICALVDHTDTVVGKIIADPEIYTHPIAGHRVVLNDTAMVGDKWDGTAFHRKVKVL